MKLTSENASQQHWQQKEGKKREWPERAGHWRGRDVFAAALLLLGLLLRLGRGRRVGGRPGRERRRDGRRQVSRQARRQPRFAGHWLLVEEHGHVAANSGFVRAKPSTRRCQWRQYESKSAA